MVRVSRFVVALLCATLLPTVATAKEKAPADAKEAASRIYDRWFRDSLKADIKRDYYDQNEIKDKHIVPLLGNGWRTTCPELDKVLNRAIAEVYYPFTDKAFSSAAIRETVVTTMTQSFSFAQLLTYELSLRTKGMEQLAKTQIAANKKFQQDLTAALLDSPLVPTKNEAFMEAVENFVAANATPVMAACQEAATP
jgi:hypothetical protein